MAPATGTKRGNTGDTFSNHRGAGKRRGGLRTDRDGDLVMDAGPRAKNNRVGKNKGRGAATGKSSGPTPGRNALNSASVQQKILQQMASGDAVTRAPKGPASTPKSLKELKITGWTRSTAASSEDRGISSLIAWLEKRATIASNRRPPPPGGKAREPVKVKKSQVEDDVLYIYVPSDQFALFLRIDGYVFAGTNIKIEKSQRSSSPSDMQDAPETTNDVKEMFKAFLQRRYNAEQKLLDLSSLGQDPELNALGMFNTTSTQSKFFPALMKICDGQVQTAAEKKERVQSVTLAGNELPHVAAVTTLAQTFPDLLNLDLSNNKLEKVDSLIQWKTKFRHLDHLVLSGNPIEQTSPEYHVELLKWFPTLRYLNGIRIRTDEEAANPKQHKKVPLPVSHPIFADQDGIGEKFLTTFINMFDSDRIGLANMYYDATSTFSLSVNTHAMRDPLQKEKMQPQEWDSYIKRSRNLKHVTHQPARQARKFMGPQQVQEVFSILPASRHPSLADGSKWCIECIATPGVPDPTGQVPQGLGGLLISVHGEFEEVDISTGKTKKQRSFDRTFILGPGGPTGIRVVNDMWTVRAYGGYAAWNPQQEMVPVQAAAPVQAAPVVPQVQGVPLPQAVQAGPSMEEMEQMIAEVSRSTGMKPEYSKQCLEAGDWDMQKAAGVYEQAKATLPPDAFV